jgi:chemotaxis protein CheX
MSQEEPWTQETIMKEQHVSAVMEVSSKIFSETAKLEFKQGNAYAKDYSFSPHDVSTLIGISGDLKGVVIFSFPSDVALTVANRFIELMGVPPATEFNAEAQSALAEMVNTIMGHYMIAMEERGYKVNISPPTTVMGQKLTIGLGMVDQVLGVPIDLPTGPGEVAIAFK